MWTEINLLYPLLVTLASFVLAVFASAHVVLYKRDVRAAIGWVGVIWLTPFIGSLLYVGLGINRVKRKARQKYSGVTTGEQPPHLVAPESLPTPHEHLAALVHYVNNIADEQLLRGNHFEAYDSGRLAYDAMLAAIHAARRTVSLSTYIFDNDAAGKMFVDALAAAKQRGVEIRVLIDDVGARYTFPSICGSLRKAGVANATFFPTLIPWKFYYSNLRNHRKLLVADGRVGFTGGMNIRAGHMLESDSRSAIHDMHFKVTGPVVRHMQETFVSDWEFVTGERLEGDDWFPEVELTGSCLARGIDAGPEGQGDKIRLTLLGALACARKSVTIVTPYFLPDAALVTALNTADLRGVDVQIILPEKNNLALVQWASTAMLWQVLERGVQVFLSPPPFDHTKLMIVDGYWTLLGSANWDPRSLRLNFEFNVECYDEVFAVQMQEQVRRRVPAARAVTLKDVDSRPLPVRLRDGVARLLTPYL
jgi:cardiolipin synthase